VRSNFLPGGGGEDNFSLHLESICDEIIEFQGTLCFDAHEDIKTRMERKTCDSKHRPQIIYGILSADPKKNNENLRDLYYRTLPSR